MSRSSVETEIKLPVRNRRVVLARLRRCGFRLSHIRSFETNTVLDTPGYTLRMQGTLLRLREFGAARVVTYKGPASEGRHKSREEVETTVNDLGVMQTIFLRLGLEPIFRYDKFRTEFTDGTGVATLDETPIGEYLELEGNGDWIDRVAVILGYSERDYVTKSYGRLYFEFREENPEVPRDMVFREMPDDTSKKSP